MEKSIRKCIFPVIAVLVLSSLAEAGMVPDRRKNQFATDYGYALFPYPYSLPGIGTGLGLVGGASNIAGTHTDAYGMAFGGDITTSSSGTPGSCNYTGVEAGLFVKPTEGMGYWSVHAGTE